MEIHLRLLDEDDSFEVATPNGAITLLRTGDYRIDTDPDRDATMLTVRAGQAELFSGANSVIISSPGDGIFSDGSESGCSHRQRDGRFRFIRGVAGRQRSHQR